MLAKVVVPLYRQIAILRTFNYLLIMREWVSLIVSDAFDIVLLDVFYKFLGITVHSQLFELLCRDFASGCDMELLFI